MLEIRTVQSIGHHYAKTLRTWRNNFLENWESSIKPILLQRKIEHEQKQARGPPNAERQRILEWEVEVVKRKWEVRCRLRQCSELCINWLIRVIVLLLLLRALLP